MTSVLLVRFLGLGLCAWLSGAVTETGRAEPVPATVEVLAARVDIAAGTRITRPDLLFKRVRYVKGDEPRSSLQDLDKLRGKYLTRALAQDQPLRATDLAERSADNPAQPPALPLPQGTRAVAIRLSSGVELPFILPGSRVDVLASKRLANGDTETRVCVPNVLVLAVDQPEGPAEVREQPAPLPQTATLALTPQQALTVSQAVERGSVRLVLRRPGDDNP